MNTEESFKDRVDEAQRYLAPFFGIRPLLACDVNPVIVDLPPDLQDSPDTPVMSLAVDFFYGDDFLDCESLESYDQTDEHFGRVIGSQFYQLANPFPYSAMKAGIKKQLRKPGADWGEAEAYGNLYSLVSSCCGFAFAEHKGTLGPAQPPELVQDDPAIELVAFILDSAESMHNVFREFYDAAGAPGIAELARAGFEEARQKVIDAVGFDILPQ